MKSKPISDIARECLDNAIRSWRRVLKDSTYEHHHQALRLLSVYHFERLALFGGMLPLERDLERKRHASYSS